MLATAIWHSGIAAGLGTSSSPNHSGSSIWLFSETCAAEGTLLLVPLHGLSNLAHAFLLCD